MQTRQLEVLNEIARIATLDLELRPMLQRIVDALSNKFDWEFVALAMVDQERAVFICEAVASSLPTPRASPPRPASSRPAPASTPSESPAAAKSKSLRRRRRR